MKAPIATTVLASILLGNGALPTEPVDGREVLARYEARLSKGDHVSSKGERLTTAAAILQRDREHVFLSNQGSGAGGGQDLEDNLDPYFVNRERLREFEAALVRGHLDAATARKIVGGTPLVGVTVYRDTGGNVAVDVRFIRGGQTVVEEAL